MTVERNRIGWGFWLQWVLASTVGMFVGHILAFFTGALTGFALEFLDPFTDLALGPWDPLNDLVGGIGLGIGLGIGVGVLQWLVLRRRVTGVGWWVLTSAAGCYGIIQAMFLGFPESAEMSYVSLLGLTVVVALGGAVTGILQWLVLRRQVSRAGWWVLASTVGWGLSVTVAGAFWWGVDISDAGWALVVTGAVLGAVTGGALVWLLRQPVPEA
jgi:hypothetical protein